MKKTYMLLSALFLGAGAAFGQIGTDSAVFNFTGGIQTFTVPCGVTNVTIKCYGAQGSAGANGGVLNSAMTANGGAGGLGGFASGSLAVTPSQVLNLFVGGQGAQPTGGFNGGANGGSTNAGGGGGASDVRVNGTALTDRVITAGGGGGGGRGGCEANPSSVDAGAGGVGGGGNGANGTDAPTPNSSPSGVAGGGQGGQGITGGAAGIGCSGFLGSSGTTGTSGTGGAGGAGQTCCCFSAASIPGGGGGGGGFNGGGGGGGGSAGTTGCSGNDKGGGGGGAGGTNDVSGVTSSSTASGVNLGDGKIVITWTPATMLAAPASPICVGGAVLLAATANHNTTYTWMPGNLSGSTVTVSPTTTTTYTVYGNCGDSATTTVVVNPLPVVTATAQTTFCALDGSYTLPAGSPVGGTWSGTAVSGGAFSPATAGVGTYTLTYTYADSNGCSNTATVSVTVSACTGIAEQAASSGIGVQTNPFGDQLVIQVGQQMEASRIRVSDMNGRVVYDEAMGNSLLFSINTSAWAKGSYTIEVIGAKQSAKKVVVK